MANHQQATDGTDDPAILANLIRAADQLARLLCESPDIDKLVDQCQVAMDIVGLDLCVFCDMLEDIENDVTELASILHLDIIASSIYLLLGKTIRKHLEQHLAA